MSRPYIKKPMKPFKLDTSIPIGPQLVARGLRINGDENNYILDDARIAVKNTMGKMPTLMQENHRCGCSLCAPQIYRSLKGRICKYNAPDISTMKCTWCNQITILGNTNESNN